MEWRVTSFQVSIRKKKHFRLNSASQDGKPKESSEQRTGVIFLETNFYLASLKIVLRTQYLIGDGTSA